MPRNSQFAMMNAASYQMGPDANTVPFSELVEWVAYRAFTKGIDASRFAAMYRSLAKGNTVPRQDGKDGADR